MAAKNDPLIEASLTLPGADSLAEEFRRKDSSIRARLKNRVAAIGNRTIEKAKALAPKGSGKLRSKSQKRYGHNMIPKSIVGRFTEKTDEIKQEIKSKWFTSRFFETGVSKTVSVRGWVRKRGNKSTRNVARAIRARALRIDPRFKVGKRGKHFDNVIRELENSKGGLPEIHRLYLSKRGTGKVTLQRRRYQHLAKRPHISVALEEMQRNGPTEMATALREGLND